MVKQDLVNAYQRLKKRKKLYEDATRTGNAVSGLGALLFFLSVFPVIPSILVSLFKVELLHSIISGISLGIILVFVGIRINKRMPLPSRLSRGEEEFLRIFDALENLNSYLKNEAEFEAARFQAAKIILKVEKALYEPTPKRSTYLWKALTKNLDEKLRLLRRNLKEKVLPVLKKGEKEEVKETYSILEKMAEYFLEPSVSKLDDLDESISVLPTYVEEKEPAVPLLERHPYLLHTIVISLIGLSSCIIFYVGLNYVRTSVDNAYIASTTFFAALLAGYLAIAIKKR